MRHTSHHTSSASVIAQLNTLTSCEIKTDVLSLGLYATDASLYQLMPLGVAIPKHEAELIDVIKLANEHNIPVLARGSATSLAGQTTNEALIIDFTKYFNRILEVNVDDRYAIVQPGVVRDQLNIAIKPHGLHFAPDPATSSRATIGGMIANNSSGTKSIKYGKTIDHVLSLRILLMDGTILHLDDTSPTAWDIKSRQDTREGDIYRRFRTLIFEHSEAIKDAFPKVMRRVQGYPLDEYVYSEAWNLAKIFVGSEGSLGIILDAKVNLEPIPKYKAAFTVHYDDRMKAIREVKEMVEFTPAAIEMLDYHVFMQSVKNNMTKSLHHRLIQGSPQATLTVELFCLSQSELDEKITHFQQWLEAKSTAYAYPILSTDSQLEDAWALRKNGLGLIMGDPSGRKPIPFIEDQAIPLPSLADYIQDVLDICEKYGVETILYAHASVGVLHVRPGLDVKKQEDINLMKKISDEVFHLVQKYKGSWSGEHGDGRNRGHRLYDYFGKEVYGCLQEVKNIFDPKNLMNPGIIIDVQPMDQHLRYGAGYKDHPYDYIYKYRSDHSFEAIVHNCSGVGACRNHIGGTMCPSFKGTADEDASTRGRANALRLALGGKLGFEGLTDPKVLEVLDLCLSCKACKSECPSNVDMAKLKSEVLQKKYDKDIITLLERAISANVDLVPMMAGWKAPIVNFGQKTWIFKFIAEKILRIDRRRTLPSYATESLTHWYKKHYTSNGSTNKIALFADTYINYHETHIGKSAIQLLNDCGYDVVLASVGCCQRPRISNGFLKEAKEAGTAVIKALLPYIQQGIKVVVCEPSCTSALIDDLPDLIEDDDDAATIKNNVMAIDVFLSEALVTGQLKGRFIPKATDILLHGHCHQKTSYGTAGMKSIFEADPKCRCMEPDTGCCGMAGAFGYEKKHYDLSKKISELVLVPAIQKSAPDTMIVANGFSCRHQINDFTSKKAVHWVESVEFVHDA